MADSARLHTLIDAYLDERITPDDMAALDALLRSSLEARTTFRESMRDHHALIESLIPRALPADAPQSASPKSKIKNHNSKISSPIPFIIYPVSIAAAALLTAAIVVVYLLAFTTPADPQPDPIKPDRSGAPGPAVATLIENTGDLRTPHGYPAEGEDFSAGEYTLSNGTAEFMLTNAVNVKLRGESRMWMRNDMNVALTRGSADFVVPSGASGFAVRLPDGSRVVDLGTAFSVSIDENGRGSTTVTQGSVRVESAKGTSVVEVGYTARVVDGSWVIAKSTQGGVAVSADAPLRLSNETETPFGHDRNIVAVDRVVASTTYRDFEAEFLVDSDPAIDDGVNRWVAENKNATVTFSFAEPVDLRGIKIDWAWDDRDDGTYAIVVNGSTSLGSIEVSNGGTVRGPAAPVEGPTYLRFERTVTAVESITLKITGRDLNPNALAEVTFYGPPAAASDAPDTTPETPIPTQPNPE